MEEKSLEYNTERTGLKIPEYGRHVQKMVDYAISLDDIEKRNNVAKAIIGVMGNMSPHLRDVEDFQHKLWDQLFIISGFNLEVDSPYPKLSKEVLTAKPERLPYPSISPSYKYYGNNIKKIITVVSEWEESDKKKNMVVLIANHMKKSYLTWNKDTVDDTTIFNHLKDLSQGKLVLTAETATLASRDRLISNNLKENPNKNLRKKRKY